MAETTIQEELKSILPEYNYNSSYKQFDVVSNTTGTTTNFYIAKQNVPRHVSIEDKQYWKRLNKEIGA